MSFKIHHLKIRKKRSKGSSLDGNTQELGVTQKNFLAKWISEKPIEARLF